MFIYLGDIWWIELSPEMRQDQDSSNQTCLFSCQNGELTIKTSWIVPTNQPELEGWAYGEFQEMVSICQKLRHPQPWQGRITTMEK